MGDDGDDDDDEEKAHLPESGPPHLSPISHGEIPISPHPTVPRQMESTKNKFTNPAHARNIN